jgi:hypothetical protein
MSDDLTREEVHHAVDRLVEELLERAGVTAPPVDAVALARRHLGLPAPTERRPRGRRGPRAEMDERPEPGEERKQWEAAQAVGAHFKPELLRRLGVEPAEGQAPMGESPANLFARHLLVPRCWFAGDARSCGYDLLALLRRYSTAGHEVLAWRLLDLPEPCIITVVDNDHVHRRSSNAWPVRRELSGPERRCQRYVNQNSRPRIVQADGWTVQGWPIHQPDWKREVLRSVVEGEAAVD